MKNINALDKIGRVENYIDNTIYLLEELISNINAGFTSDNTLERHTQICHDYALSAKSEIVGLTSTL